jgi:hypothetical protein
MLAYYAHMFQYWNGSINYGVDVVATQFHSARIKLGFASGIYSFPPVLAPEDLETLPYTVMDIQGSTMVLHSVPYNHNNQYCEVIVASKNSVGIKFSINDLNNELRSTGTFFIVVDNVLRCPDNVAQTITINIWVWGGPDFTCAIPSNPLYCPVNLTVPFAALKARQERKDLPVKANKKKFNKRPNPRAQSDLNTVPASVNIKVASPTTSVNVAPSPLSSKQKQVAALVLGEDNIHSLRTLMRMQSPVFYLNIPADNIAEIDPAWFSPTNDTTSTNRANVLARVYVFYRGGNEYIIYPYGVTQDFPTYFVSSEFTFSSVVDSPNVYAAVTDRSIGFSQVYATNNTPFIEVSLPYYAPQGVSSVVTDVYGAPRPLLWIEPVFTEAIDVVILQGKRHDFSFYGLVGPPNLQLYTALA